MNTEEIKTFLTLKLGNLNHPDIILNLPEELVVETFKEYFPEFASLPNSIIMAALYNRFRNKNLYKNRNLNKEMEEYKNCLWQKVIQDHE